VIEVITPPYKEDRVRVAAALQDFIDNPNAPKIDVIAVTTKPRTGGRQSAEHSTLGGVRKPEDAMVRTRAMAPGEQPLEKPQHSRPAYLDRVMHKRRVEAAGCSPPGVSLWDRGPSGRSSSTHSRGEETRSVRRPSADSLVELTDDWNPNFYADARRTPD
jgi:hypothetical protein